MSFRARLALGAAAALLSMWLFASLLVYGAVSRSGEERIDAQLMQQAQQLRSAASADRQGGRINRLGGEPGRLAARRSPVEGGALPTRIARRELLGRVIVDGAVVLESQPLQELGALPLPTAEQAGSPSPSLTNVQVGEQSLRVLVQAVDRGAVIQVALPRDDLDALLDRLRTLLLACALAATALAAWVGWRIAGSALRPVAELTDAARHVAETGDLANPVPHLAGSDEIARLSRTFNGMLSSLASLRLAQERFVAEASHELRTPITSLRGNVDFLARADVEAEQRAGAMQDVLADVERIDTLAGDLLVLARIDAAPTLARESIDVGELLTSIRDRHSRSDHGHGIEFEGDSGGASPVVVADRQLLDRALNNLVVNALRYTPPGTTIHVGSRTHEGGVELYVRDDGPGMTAHDAAHAFDRFHRGASARETDGTGLGLAIVDGAARAHGGTATIDAAPGAGCVVRICIPQGSAWDAGESKLRSSLPSA